MSYQPKTGQKCSCRRGIERDNCPTCEGTGWVIDFKAIRLKAAQDKAAREVIDEILADKIEAAVKERDEQRDEH